MCSSPKFQVEVLPDGQIAEYHEFTDEQMKSLQESINRLIWKVQWVSSTLSGPRELVFGGSNAGDL